MLLSMSKDIICWENHFILFKIIVQCMAYQFPFYVLYARKIYKGSMLNINPQCEKIFATSMSTLWEFATSAVSRLCLKLLSTFHFSNNILIFIRKNRHHVSFEDRIYFRSDSNENSASDSDCTFHSLLKIRIVIDVVCYLLK